MNLKVGFRRVYLVLHLCWVLAGLSLYLLDWPGDWEHDPESKLWMTRADNIAACQTRARSYDHEESFNNVWRQARHELPEVLNFGRDERGLQITTLKDALRECEQRYPFPKAGSAWRGVFRDLRHESSSVRAILAVLLFFVPTFAYLLLYALTLAVVLSLRWIGRGFKMTSTGS